MSDEKQLRELQELENQEWLYSLDYVLQNGGRERVIELLNLLQIRAHKAGVQLPFSANTPYINTIPRDKQVPFPETVRLKEELNRSSVGTQWRWLPVLIN